MTQIRKVIKTGNSLAITIPSKTIKDFKDAIKAAIDEALKCKETGEEKTILSGLTGTGYFDMTAYSSYIEHTMGDYIPTDEELKKYANELPKV